MPAPIQVWTWPTPNGHKVHILLEELIEEGCGIPYEVVPVAIGKGEQFRPEFLAITPNHRIPAIVDPDGPDGRPFNLFESGAILIYLAEKAGSDLIPQDPATRYAALQWLMFQMGGVGPMFGQLGFFHKFAGKDIEDKRPFERYRAESERLLKVLDGQLEGRDWIVGEYSVADIAVAPWVRSLTGFYEAGPLVGWDGLRNVPAWMERFLARPAVQRGLDVPVAG